VGRFKILGLSRFGVPGRASSVPMPKRATVYWVYICERETCSKCIYLNIFALYIEQISLLERRLEDCVQTTSDQLIELDRRHKMELDELRLKHSRLREDELERIKSGMYLEHLYWLSSSLLSV